MDKDVIKLCKYHLAYGKDKFGPATQRIGVLCDLKHAYNMSDIGVQRLNTMHWISNTACCAGLRSSHKPVSKYARGLKAIISVSQSEGGRALKKEEAIKFYDILINHTPYGECIVVKDAEYAYEYGLILDADAPARIIAGTLMAQRLAWEYVHIAESMIAYASLGVNKSVSFLLGHTYTKAGGKTNSSGHCCLNSINISHSFIKNFVLGTFTPDEPYSVCKTYEYNVHSTFNKAAPHEEFMAAATDGPHVSTLIDNYAKSLAKKALNLPNPFAKSLVLLDNVTDATTIADYFKENLGDILGD